MGTGSINGTGNDLANFITRNDAANGLEGNLNNDTLYRATSNNTLIGGLGKDALTRSTGAGTFVFNAATQPLAAPVKTGSPT